MLHFRTFAIVLVCLAAPAIATTWAQKKDSGKSVPKDPPQLVEWAIKAHGGEAKLAKTAMMTRRLFCGVDLPEVGMIPFYLDNVWIMPDKYRVRFQMPQANGKWAWRESVYNDGKAFQSLHGLEKELASSELTAVKEQVYVENLCRLLPLRESRYELMMLNEIEFDNRTLLGISVSSKGYKPVNLYFDKKTGFLTKVQYPVLGMDSLYTNQDVYFRDYRDFSGIKHWRRVSVVTEGGRSFEAELVDIRFPDKIRDEYFELPKEKAKDKDKEKDKGNKNKK